MNYKTTLTPIKTHKTPSSPILGDLLINTLNVCPIREFEVKLYQRTKGELGGPRMLFFKYNRIDNIGFECVTYADCVLLRNINPHKQGEKFDFIHHQFLDHKFYYMDYPFRVYFTDLTITQNQEIAELNEIVINQNQEINDQNMIIHDLKEDKYVYELKNEIENLKIQIKILTQILKGLI